MRTTVEANDFMLWIESPSHPDRNPGSAEYRLRQYSRSFYRLTLHGMPAYRNGMNQTISATHAPVRRPLSSRNTKVAENFARWLTRRNITPNQISVLSVCFAALAAICLISGAAINFSLFIVAAVAIQLRLLCNLMDGMVAVEGGKKTKTGELYNEFPDRIADLLILVGAGYAVASYPFGLEFGWCAGALALLTAYVRALAGSAGVSQSFMGPMAKPHRMAIMTLASLGAAAELALNHTVWSLYAGLGIVVIGSLITVIRRLTIAATELEGA